LYPDSLDGGTTDRFVLDNWSVIPPEQIDADALKVVRRLVHNGYAAYLVGGCVRDLLLSRKPKDFDVATSATPPEIKALFRNCRIIGRRFRLAHIFFGPKIIETSTFRANPREAEAEANEASGETSEELLIRRDNVFGSAEEDARRRDFTINGLFYDVDAGQVIDYVAGQSDLEARTVRTIGDPDIRFREDPVRILRAIKFAARLGFTIDPAAYQAILTHKGEIAKCAAPRVLEEIYRLLRSGAARHSLELLEDTGVLDVLIPPLAALMKNSAADRNRLYQTIDGIDAMVRNGDAPTNALLVCGLVAPFLVDVLYGAESAPPDQRGDFGLIIWERARPILEAMRASRRDSEFARQMLLAQRRLGPSKRRRSRPMALAKRDWFGEALALFELQNPGAEGEVAEEIARWKRMLQDSHHAPPAREGEPSAPHGGSQGAPQGGHGGSEGEQRRRRRRRGGRRRRRGDRIPTVATTSQPQSPPAEAPAKPKPDGEYDIWKE
jgi:poly(A) polymerase